MPQLYKTHAMPFAQLKLANLYAVLRLRQQIFMLEQQSIYEDIDNHDQLSWHVCIYQGDELVGYARARETDNGQMAKIERVVCAASHRRTGLGKELIKQCISIIEQHYAVKNIMLSAQTNAIAFYRKFGFEKHGLVYDDGGIEHIDMYLSTL
ncbi:GNAT family N-acetyltransferase [Paraglaciecola polaris]|uniref:ElaA protein n=1 Tax=Paraglaciecola polaris LMG 21857 TaxID=1129793 RepID=K7A7I0_9ALTE|nr:GNAT family N-acetyltransferase [Paraglaciecola polaris]GAC31415.1 ElaA protein [Paraglaciecola polaris LMG 21857]